MQSEQHRGALHGRGRGAPVFLGDVFKGKVTLGRHFPEEPRIELGRRRLGRFQEFRGRRRLKREEYLRRLDLRASARRHGHLVGVARFAYDGARLEGAVLFKIQIHDVVTSWLFPRGAVGLFQKPLDRGQMLFVVMELMPVVFARHEVFLAVELERVVSVEHFVAVRENEQAP